VYGYVSAEEKHKGNWYVITESSSQLQAERYKINSTIDDGPFPYPFITQSTFSYLLYVLTIREAGFGPSRKVL
jgi:hypothetical protein